MDSRLFLPLSSPFLGRDRVFPGALEDEQARREMGLRSGVRSSPACDLMASTGRFAGFAYLFPQYGFPYPIRHVFFIRASCFFFAASEAFRSWDFIERPR